MMVGDFQLRPLGIIAWLFGAVITPPVWGAPNDGLDQSRLQESRIEFMLVSSASGNQLIEELSAHHFIQKPSAKSATIFILHSSDPVAARLKKDITAALEKVPFAEIYKEEGKISPVEEDRLRLAFEPINTDIHDVTKNLVESQADGLISASPLPLQRDLLIPFLRIESEEIEKRDYVEYLKVTQELLDDLKVQYKVEESRSQAKWIIEILPQGTSPLNKFAKSYLETHDVDRFYFDPTSPAQASYRRGKSNRSVRTGRPAVLFLTGTGLITLRHEGLHAVLTSLHEKGIASIYNTKFRSDDPKSVDGVYSRYFSAQELATMSADLRQLGILLQRAKDPQRSKSLADRIYHKINYMQLIARQIEVQVRKAQSNDHREINYLAEDKIWTVEIKVGSQSRIALPYLYKEKPSRELVLEQAAQVFNQLNGIAQAIDLQMSLLDQAMSMPKIDTKLVSELASRAYYSARTSVHPGLRSVLDLGKILDVRDTIAEDCAAVFR